MSKQQKSHSAHMNTSLFDIQKSPLIIEKEAQLLELEIQKKNLNTQLRRKKTILQKWKEEIVEIQSQMFGKAMKQMHEFEKLRKDILSLCRKILKSKKVSKEDKEEIKKFEEDLSSQNFAPEEMEEMMRQRNKESDSNDQRFKFFEKMRVEPEHKEQRSIRKIFLRLAAQFHPDKARTDKEKELCHSLMKSINEAYEKHDVEALLNIEAEYGDVEAFSITINIPDETDHLQKLEKDIERIGQEVGFLKNQLESVGQEFSSVKKSEPGKMLQKKKKAEKQGKDGYKTLMEDIEMGYQQLQALKKTLEQCAKSGKMPHITDHIMDGPMGELMVDDMMEAMKEDLGSDFEDEGISKEVMRKVVNKMGKAMMRGEEPDMEDFHEMLMEALMEDAFTEVYKPKPKKTIRKKKTKRKKKK